MQSHFRQPSLPPSRTYGQHYTRAAHHIGWQRVAQSRSTLRAREVRVLQHFTVRFRTRCHKHADSHGDHRV